MTEMPNGWTSSDLKDLASVEMGQSPSSDFYRESPEGVPFLQGNADFGARTPRTRVYCTRPEKLCQKDDILISVRAPVGDLNIADKQYCIGRGVASIRIQPSKIGRIFLFYALLLERRQLSRLMQGTTFEAVNKNDIESIHLTVPRSLEEQNKIAAILQNVDDTIDGTREVIEKHKKIKQGLMQDLFSKGLDENGKMHSDLKNSELGQIPRNWSIRKIGDFFKNLRTGSTPSRKYPEYFNGSILWVTSGELKYRVITDTLEKITEKAVKETNLRLYPAGTFFIAITGLEAEGTLGSCAMIGKPATTNQSCMAFEKNKHVDLDFLFQYYCYYGKNLIYKYAQGTKQQSLNRSIVEEIPIKIPATIEEQKRIGKILSDVDRSISSEEEYLYKLIRIKSGLMQDLLTGRGRVGARHE